MDDTLVKEDRILPEDIQELILEDEELAVLEDEESGGGLVEDVIVDEDGDIVADGLIDEDESDGDMIEEALVANPAEDAAAPEDTVTPEDAAALEDAVTPEETGEPETVSAPEETASDEDPDADGIAGGHEKAQDGDIDLPEDGRGTAKAPETKIVVGVRFRSVGKSYYFAVGDLPVKRGSHVIVETSRGLDFGTSVCDPIEIDRRRFKAPVKRIVRMATPADESRVRDMREKEHDAYRVCYEKIRRRSLDMKLISAEYAFDGSKLLFYFTADERVDFRDLVKDLAGVFHTRIELRQIGVRDETRILGGYGICGRPLCCHTYLTDFAPVSIKMAKEQNLSLNPTKISGSCGRLMCCLKNEEEVYEELNQNLPKPGDEVEGNDGLTGEVIGVDILRQMVRMLVEVDDQKELHEYPADQITILRRRKRGQAKPKVNRSELRDPKGVRRRPAPGAPGTAGPEQEAPSAGPSADAGNAAGNGTGRTEGKPRRERDEQQRRSRTEARTGKPEREDPQTAPAGQNASGGRRSGRRNRPGTVQPQGEAPAQPSHSREHRRDNAQNTPQKPRVHPAQESPEGRDLPNSDSAAQPQRHRRNRRRSGTGNERNRQTPSGETE